eukprot:gene3350-4201_t
MEIQETYFRKRDYEDSIESVSQAQKKLKIDNNNNNNNINNNNNNSNNEVSISCFDYLPVEVIVKIFNFCNPFSSPLHLVCKLWYELSFNSLLINDDAMSKILSNLSTPLEHLSVMAAGHANLEFIKRSGKPWTPKSTISPLSLFSISTLSQLKTLKFSLLPQFGNHKALTEIVPEIADESSMDHHQSTSEELDQAISSLLKIKGLQELELMSCNITSDSLCRLLDQFHCLNRLVLYRNSALSQLRINSDSLTSISFSCLSMVQYIEVKSPSLQEFSIEGCESLQSTDLWVPNLQMLSFESCSGKLNLVDVYKLSSLSLFECRDITQKNLDKILNSLPSLEELYIYLQQIENLRISSLTLKKLDIEAWNGISSCILDCPSMEELKASESSLESICLKADHVNNIELDFCDSLRTVLIDTLSCRHFSFTQNHPSPSNFNVDLRPFQLAEQDESSKKEVQVVEDDDDEDDSSTTKNNKQSANNCGDSTNNNDNGTRSNQTYLSPTTIFFQSHYFIQDCIVLSGNLLGKLSTRVIGSLSVEQKSLSTYVIEASKICKLNTYRESRNCKSSGSRSPRFIPISLAPKGPSSYDYPSQISLQSQDYYYNNNYNNYNNNNNNNDYYYNNNNNNNNYYYPTTNNNNNSNINYYCNNNNNSNENNSNFNNSSSNRRGSFSRSPPYRCSSPTSSSFKENYSYNAAGFLDEYGGNSNLLNQQPQTRRSS